MCAITDVSHLEFVTGPPGPQGPRAPGPLPGPAPPDGQGQGVIFGIPCHSPRPGTGPTYPPDGCLLKFAGDKWGPVQGMSRGVPWTGVGRG